jgi:hypothetical protein
MKKLFSILLLATLAVSAWGANLTTTTFSAAVSKNDQIVSVASASGMTARSTQTNTILFSGREAMRVATISSTKITVERGTDGTKQYSHASGETVYVGAPGDFHSNDPAGTCTTTEQALPFINITNGKIFDCRGSVWVEGAGQLGTPVSGITAIDLGAGAHHTTSLTFTDLAIGSVTNASKGIGVLLYTLPAGAIGISSAYMSVALAGSGSGCDADTPDTGLGTVIASGVVATLDGTATFEDILTGQTSNDVNGTAEVKTVVGQPVAIEAAGAHTVHLNVADGWAASCNITGTGTVVIEWTLLQ